MLIADRFGIVYPVAQVDRANGRAVFRVFRGFDEIGVALVDCARPSVTDVVIYKGRRNMRRRGIGSALYAEIERALGRPLVPSRIRTPAGKAFWKRRRQASST